MLNLIQNLMFMVPDIARTKNRYLLRKELSSMNGEPFND